MTKLVNLRELKRQYQLEPRRCVAQLHENLEAGKLRPENFSVRDLFEALIPNGTELLHEMSFRRSGGLRVRDVVVMERAEAVSTGDFTNIIGQIVYNKVRDEFNAPDIYTDELCTTQTTEFLDGERIPGVGGIGDKAELVGEGEPFPDVGLNEEWTDTAATKKRGFIVPVTREIIVADRTSLVMRRAGQGGRWMGLNKFKRVLDCVVGNANNYNRNGVSSNTYLTSGSYINSQTGNALDGSANEWRALEKAELLFDAITDPNTGEPINVEPKVLIVPSALKRTANRIVGATEVQTVDLRAQATTIRTTSGNPYAGAGLKVLSGPYVKARSTSTTKWWFGNPKEAFLYMQVWAQETTQAASNNEAEFRRDVWAQFKVSERGVGQVYEPRYMTQNDT